MQQVLVYEHRGSIYEIADMLGVSHDTLRSQLRPESQSISLDFIRAAYWVTRDHRLKQILLWPGVGTQFLAQDYQVTGTLERALGNLHIEAGNLHAITRALKGQCLSGDKGRSLLRETKEVKTEVLQIEREIEAAMGGQGCCEVDNCNT